MSRRVLSGILEWRNDPGESFLVVTMNRTEGLPPELLRRFEKMFFTDIPQADEQRQVAEIHLRKRDVMPDYLDDAAWKKILGNTTNFIHSEMEKLVVVARQIAFQRAKVGQPSVEDFIEAAGSIIPLAEQDKEGVAAIRKFCQGVATPVSRQKRAKREPRQRPVDTAS